MVVKVEGGGHDGGYGQLVQDCPYGQMELVVVVDVVVVVEVEGGGHVGHVGGYGQLVQDCP